MLFKQRLKARAAYVLRLAAQILPLLSQQVVCQEDYRLLPQDPAAQDPASESLLQFIERLGSSIAPYDDLSIKHCPVGQGQARLRQFGKLLADKFFPPRPYPGLTAALDQLRADAIPFPLHQPVSGRTE